MSLLQNRAAAIAVAATIVVAGLGYAVWFSIGQSQALHRQGDQITSLVGSAEAATVQNRVAVRNMRKAFRRLDHRNALLHKRMARLILRLGSRAGIETEGLEATSITSPPFEGQFRNGGGAGGSGEPGGSPPPSPQPSPTVGQGQGNPHCPPKNPHCGGGK